MSQPTDDQRILAEIEHGIARDDPALAALISALNEQFPQEPTQPRAARAKRRNPRVVAAVVLSVIALLALALTAVLSGSASRTDEDSGPAALPTAAARYEPW
ncbi:DUF3040 domain-containing protein [Streptomyces sp. NPDC008122]|uniref:DUF3040 domain-containing protein n=1 Tax=Streptomyces sp. NPDC008122 TaxID=3364810 RepID=UPI0036E256B4